jgi:hypothetical protein
MPPVACPKCGEVQEAGASGYTCTNCGTVWGFATCDHCGARFHMRPGTTEWTCPDCGTEHGGTTMGQLEPDDVEPVAPSVPAPDAAGPSATGPSPALTPARAAAASSRGGPPSRARLATIAVIGIVAVLAIAFGLSALGGGNEQAGSPTPTSSLDAREALCLHLRDLQMPREDSLARLAVTLQSDADTFQAQGRTGLATKVLNMKTAVLAYRDVLVNHGDLGDVETQIGKAVSALPC